MLLAAPLLIAATDAAQGFPDLAHCLEEQGLTRIARVLGPDRQPAYARVVDHEDGALRAVAPIADDSSDLAFVFERAADSTKVTPVWRIADSERSERICAPFHLEQDSIDAENHVVVAAGLNYAAHAEEAGGGNVFLFPKPVSPTAPYGQLVAPAGVRLLDYEVELGFVLLADVDLRALPGRDDLLARSAFFVANEITDREPIIRHATLSGPGDGFVEAKGQPGFLPAGPWLVRGHELFTAVAACGEEGLGMRLEVDEGDGFETRQNATSAAMILDPLELLQRLADEVARHGARTPMPVLRADGVRHYPLAVEDPDGTLRLPAGSVVLTGTPEGVALQAPSPLGVVLRGLLHLRGPFEQFRREELARAAKGGPGGYLAPGDRVRARIDGLGAQVIRIGEPGSPPHHASCPEATEVLVR